MLDLCTLFLSGVLAGLGARADSTPDAHLTLPVAATDVQVRFDVHGWRSDDARLALMRKSDGEYLLAAGHIGATDDVMATIHGGPARGKTGADVRQKVLAERLLGMGLSDVAGYASAQTIRQLNPPYRNFDRHVFLVAADAMVHLQVIALETEVEKFGDAGFEALARGARFAIVRRTDWDDLTSRYLELSHAAALRADGLAWLREQASAPGATWIEKIAAAEHAHAARVTEAWVFQLDKEVHDELAARPERTRAEDAGLLLANDGIGLSFLRTGDVASAEAPIAAALAIADRLGGRAAAGARASVACLAAAKKDVDAVVKALGEAYAVDPALRYRLQTETLLEPVTKDPRVVELLTIKLQMRPNRQLGH